MPLILVGEESVFHFAGKPLCQLSEILFMHLSLACNLCPVLMAVVLVRPNQEEVLLAPHNQTYFTTKHPLSCRQLSPCWLELRLLDGWHCP